MISDALVCCHTISQQWCCFPQDESHTIHSLVSLFYHPPQNHPAILFAQTVPTASNLFFCNSRINCSGSEPVAHKYFVIWSAWKPSIKCNTRSPLIPVCVSVAIVPFSTRKQIALLHRHYYSCSTVDWPQKYDRLTYLLCQLCSSTCTAFTYYNSLGSNSSLTTRFISLI